MFCSQCGKEIANDSKVCSYCGVPVQGTEEAGYTQPLNSQPYQAPPNGQPYQTPPGGQPYQVPPNGQPYQTPPIGQPYQAQSYGQPYQMAPAGQPYYNGQSNQGYNLKPDFKYNLAAAFFPGLWALFKGMWDLAIVEIVIGCISVPLAPVAGIGVIIGIVMTIFNFGILGRNANYYYRLKATMGIPMYKAIADPNLRRL